MPILSSLGALTYSRSGEGAPTPWKYWSLMYNGSNTSLNTFAVTSFFDSTGNIFVNGEYKSTPSSPLPFISKVNLSNVGNIPTIQFTGNISPDANIKLICESSSNIHVLGSGGFTYNNVGYSGQTKFDINSSTGALSSITGQTPSTTLSGGSGSPRERVPLSAVFDTTGNYTVLGSVNPKSLVSSVYYDNNQAYLTKFNSSGNILIQKNFGLSANTTVSGYNVYNEFSLGVDSGNNYRVAINNGFNVGSYPVGVIANINAAISSINWQKKITHDGNVLYFQDSVTANNATYGVMSNPYDGANICIITKIDSTGNTVWGKQTTTETGLNPKITEHNGNLYIFQLGTSGPGTAQSSSYIINMDAATGNVHWERKYTYYNDIYECTASTSDVIIKNDLLVCSHTLSCHNPTLNVGFTHAALFALPSDGTIPSDGHYILDNKILPGDGSLYLDYQESSNFPFTNISLSTTAANNVLMNPLPNNYFNPATITTTSINLTPDFCPIPNEQTPTNLVPPIISGEAYVNSVLDTTDGTWASNLPVDHYTYQWLKNSANISGATSNTFILTNAQVGGNIKCAVTAYNALGNTTILSSNTIGPISPPLGAFMYGGYCAGISNGNIIIVAPIAGMSTSFGNYSTANTYCNNLVYNGYSDWILPSIDELAKMCDAKTIFASIGQPYNTIPNASSSVYWSSTNYNGLTTFKYTQYFWNCSTYDAATTDQLSFRAIRRQPLPV